MNCSNLGIKFSIAYNLNDLARQIEMIETKCNHTLYVIIHDRIDFMCKEKRTCKK